MSEEQLQLFRQLKTVKERVEFILRKYPDARNNDFYLWILYVRLFEPELRKYIKFIPYEVIKKATPIETIRRMRQKIQEEGKFLPTDPKVLKKRKRLAKAYKNIINIL